MQKSFVVFITFIMLAGALLGCTHSSSAEAGTEITAEEVLQTAEAIAAATRNADTATPTQSPLTATPSPVPETETPAPTATPNIALAEPLYNAYVRSGPGANYKEIDFFLIGQQAEVIGQFYNEESGTWWYLQRIEQGRDGWIWEGAVTVFGDTSGIPFLAAPPEDGESD